MIIIYERKQKNPPNGGFCIGVLIPHIKCYSPTLGGYKKFLIMRPDLSAECLLIHSASCLWLNNRSQRDGLRRLPQMTGR